MGLLECPDQRSVLIRKASHVNLLNTHLIATDTKCPEMSHYLELFLKGQNLT